MPSSLQQLSLKPVAEPDPGTQAAPRRFQVSVEDLCRGMYVAELDRPWLDTPFLLQGFLIDSDIELETVRKHCRHVMVDPSRSTPNVIGQIRDADALEREPPAAGQPVLPDTLTLATDTVAVPAEEEAPRSRARRAYRIRADVRVNQSTRERFRRFVRETSIVREPEADSRLERVVGWLRRSVRQRPAAWPLDLEQRRELLPLDVVPVHYEDARPMEAELKRAAQTFGRGEHLLRSISEQVRSGRPPDLSTLADVTNAIAGSIADNPDAMMWVASLREQDL
ncbi:MAG: DUF3391 domain-containing protein, partial [Burkholderiales bacterium]